MRFKLAATWKEVTLLHSLNICSSRGVSHVKSTYMEKRTKRTTNIKIAEWKDTVRQHTHCIGKGIVSPMPSFL